MSDPVPQKLTIKIDLGGISSPIRAHVVEYPSVKTWTYALSIVGIVTDSDELCRRVQKRWYKYWYQTHPSLSPDERHQLKSIQWSVIEPRLPRDPTGSSKLSEVEKWKIGDDFNRELSRLFKT